MTFASLFSGCGGFDLGFEDYGFQSLGAFDSDPDAVQNYSRNLGGPITQVDLTTELPGEKAFRGVDVLAAGPPCQGFSTVGKRELNDERNYLLTLTGFIARRVKPRVLVVENVPGSVAGEHGRYLNALESMMRLSGYSTRTIMVQVSNLGMAQLRRRVLFFAWNTGRDFYAEPLSLPAADLKSILIGATKLPNHDPKFLEPGTKEWQIARKIGPGQKLSNVRGGSNAVATWDIPEVFGPISDNERTVLELLRRLRRQDRVRQNGDADPVSIARLEAALGPHFVSLVGGLIEKGYLRRASSGVDLVGTFNGKFRRLSWERPSSTVDTRFGSPRYFLHPSQQRGFSVREAARIQGFPDSFFFHGTNQIQHRIVGNAVPPPLGAFAARTALRLLGRII